MFRSAAAACSSVLLGGGPAGALLVRGRPGGGHTLRGIGRQGRLEGGVLVTTPLIRIDDTTTTPTPPRLPPPNPPPSRKFNWKSETSQKTR